MSSTAAHMHLVTPPGHNGEDENPGLDVDLTNDDSENVPPMVVGGPACGHLSTASDIPFLSSKTRNVTLVYAIDTLPDDLHDVNAPRWTDT
jgi:hypothetical protein